MFNRSNISKATWAGKALKRQEVLGTKRSNSSEDITVVAMIMPPLITLKVQRV